MNPTNAGAVVRTRQILNDLEGVRENLLALSDDIWLSIDHNDSEALEAGVEFKRAFNAKAAAFDVVASDLSELVQQYTSVRLEESEQSGGADERANDRIIAELNRNEPHSLDEDFTFKRPHGVIFQSKATTGITTWQRLYELILRHLYDADPDTLSALCGHPDFTTNRGNPMFTRDRDRLRKSMEIRDGLYVESNLSANGIRDLLRRVLETIGIDTQDVQIFLRQDRDAGRTVNE